jgi:double zinc ribbon protein
MARCTSCGSEVDDAASFCTSCGQRMPAASQPAAEVAATRAVCAACGAQTDPGFAFCTNCGRRIAAQALDESAIVEPAAGDAAAAPVTSVVSTPQPPGATRPASAELSIAPMPEKTVVAPAAPPLTVAEDAATQPAAPQIAPPVSIYAAPSGYSPEQPGSGAFRTVVLILLLVIVVGVFGGWYFWGVETVIVCSPPDVRVFLDDKELTPSSYGRYVVSHLSRQAHLLRVQRPGFADTLQKLDFPLTSTQEWVNIKLVPRRQPE